MAEAVAGAAALYGAETTVEAGVAAYFISQPTLPLKAKLEHIASSFPLPRSSHTLSVIGTKAYIFGGEIKPREPVANNVEVLQLSTTETTTATSESIAPRPADGSEGVPEARVGHTAATARNRIFIFGGRGGAEMTALPENGRLWVFDPAQSTWLFLDPPPDTDFPCARSYHASTASEDGNAIFIHAGCASDGSRLADTWAFYLDEGKWTKLADAPGPPRGGPALTYGQGKLWRFGGFDGKTELGGALDSLDLPAPRTMGQPGKDIDDKAEWKSLPFDFEDREASSTSSVPAHRSLAALHFITTGQGRDYLVLALGEGDPSTVGHAGAGKFFQDIWAYQLPSSGWTGAGVKDTIREKLPGVSLTRGQWAQVEIAGLEVGAEEKQGGKWTGRGWFGSASTGKSQFMCFGGIDESNERLGDGWMIKIQ